MELALEGERLCRAGDCHAGVQYFEAAVKAGTEDFATLSAIYSRLGNAYFYLQEYGKALEFHKHDLNLARTLGDKAGEAKASGNLGNTLKVLNKFDEAIVCCQRHLDISQEIGDKVGKARALYNLGNVYHTKGKHSGRSGQQDPGEFPPEVRESLQKAAEYYEQNLEIVQELGDVASVGRACGNLGNTYYLLGDFQKAIRYHERRLAIAKEFGDRSAERRAYTNLGNAYIFLGEFENASEHYHKTLQIAKQLSDKVLEAQACYSLGNTYTLLRDHEKAIEYHLRHLEIAQQLADRVGEGRACWSLGNAYTALGSHEKALQFAKKHLEISKEIGDKSGQISAQMHLADLRSLLGIVDNNKSSSKELNKKPERNGLSDADSDGDKDEGPKPSRTRRFSMENMELMKLTPESKVSIKTSPVENNDGDHPPPPTGAKPKTAKFQRAATVATESLHDGNHLLEPRPVARPKSAELLNAMTQEKVSEGGPDDDGFFDLLSRTQGRRIDDQRCSFRITKSKSASTESDTPCRVPTMPEVSVRKGSTSPGDEFLDMIAGLQSSRMNDQRASLPQFPGLNSRAGIRPYLEKKKDEEVPDDKFFDMLMRCQGSRLEDQRSSLPTDIGRSAPTVPDEDFFSLIQKVQSSRLEEQRTTMPAKAPNATGGKKKKK